MVPRQIFAACCFLPLLVVVACGRPAASPSPDDRPVLGTFFCFSADGDGVLNISQVFENTSELTRFEWLEKLGSHLSDTYFATINKEPTGIGFEVIRLVPVDTGTRVFRIAVINMADEKSLGLKYFFQGSLGGQATFNMITATFLQPQSRPHFIDGLVLTYNGRPFPELDHINFQGVVPPSTMEKVVVAAVRRFRSGDRPNGDQMTNTHTWGNI